LFARRGARVVAAGLNLENAEQTAFEIKNNGGEMWRAKFMVQPVGFFSCFYDRLN
jgi:predicted enzyme related to lactoylglutathione lyase